ncbi:MAG: DUF4430 domain-containing protein [Sedimentibacter sp.]
MKNKKIWLSLGCILLVICLSLVFQVTKENAKNKLSETELTQEKLDKAETTVTEDEESDLTQVDNAIEDKTIESNPEVNPEDVATASGENDTSNNLEGKSTPNSDKGQDTLNSNTNAELDNFNTEPVLDGKPLPVEWQDVKVEKEKELKCTLSVSCNTVLDNLDKLSQEKKDIIPEDGIIFKEQEVVFYEGETVFNVLLREMKKNKIHMEFTMTPIYNSNYIEGIGNLYELDCGELSGWVYKVNGWSPNYGSSRYKLTDGDNIQWQYTCDLGRDVGGESMNAEVGE